MLQTGVIGSPVLYGFRGGRGSQFGHKNPHDVEEENKVYLGKGDTSNNHYWKLCYRAVHLHTISCCRHINNEWEGTRHKSELLFETGRRLMGSEATQMTPRPTLQHIVSPSRWNVNGSLFSREHLNLSRRLISVVGRVQAENGFHSKNHFHWRAEFAPFSCFPSQK